MNKFKEKAAQHLEAFQKQKELSGSRILSAKKQSLKMPEKEPLKEKKGFQNTFLTKAFSPKLSQPSTRPPLQQSIQKPVPQLCPQQQLFLNTLVQESTKDSSQALNTSTRNNLNVSGHSFVKVTSNSLHEH